MLDMKNPKTDMNRARLVEAFTDPAFQEELSKVRLEIEAKIKEFLAHLRSLPIAGLKFYDNVESRIKTPESFQEKIYRKDYVLRWETTSDKAANQRLIAENLPDLIGFRINCFFCDHEEVIYEQLRLYQDRCPELKLDFDENTQQQNGHTLYKVSGTYRGMYSFEIQIKAIVHNIWGEVEHRTIYKDRAYDPATEDKKRITEEVFNILHASDRQLVTLFSRKNDQRRLVNALFYEITQDAVNAATGTDILGRHYTGFFQIFADTDSEQCIREKVGLHLTGGSYTAKSPAASYDEHTAKLKELIEERFLRYDLLCQFHICRQIYSFGSYDEFLYYLAHSQLASLGVLVQAAADDAFGDDPEESEESEASGQASTDQMDQDYKNILNALGAHLRSVKKDDAPAKTEAVQRG